jgi:hypothetical protein
MSCRAGKQRRAMADWVITMDLFDSADARKGFAVSAKAFDENIEPPPLTFDGR